MTDERDGLEKVKALAEAAEPVGPAETDPPGADPGPPDDGEEARAAALLARGGSFPLNDFGNGQRLITYFGENLLFVPRLGWFRWDDRLWAPDEDAIAVRADAQKIGGKILEEVAYLALEPWEDQALDLARDTASELATLEAESKGETDPPARLKELRKTADRANDIRSYLATRKRDHRNHAKTSGNSGRIANMMIEAQVQRCVGIDDLNSDKTAINTLGGILRFRGLVDEHEASFGNTDPIWWCEISEHDRAARMTKICDATYEPGAKAPEFEAFLERIQPDLQIRAFLKRWFGYCLTGLTTEQKTTFFYGAGRNGKSTLVDLIAKIMGGYSTTIPIESLTGAEQRKGSDATPDLVRLPGARFVRASEPERGTGLKEALVKQLTGGEAILVRRMQQEFVEVSPEFKLTIQGNYLPNIKGGDDGIWRRLVLVNFDEQIPIDEVDPLLPERLWAERDGVLTWLVEGALEWFRLGLAIPETIQTATENYRQASDFMRVFLTEECEIDGETFEEGKDMADAFNAWMIASGQATWRRKTITDALKERTGVVFGKGGARFKAHKRSVHGWYGIRINEEARNRIAAFSDELRARR